VVSRKPGDKPVSADYISEWREFISLYPYGTIFDWLQQINADNKQGNISAQECNEINRKLSLKSFESGYKILIMWMPEYLGNEGNKLLKLIEEPPPDTLFILVTENEAQILPTILSRVQIIRLPRPQVAEIQEALVSRAGVQPEQARQLAAVSEQNYREALRQLQHGQDDWQSLLRNG
jgi:DNA polymerase-3 subunit delta'